MLNPEQEQVMEELIKFTQSKHNQIILSGRAGSGKSFLVNAFIERYRKLSEVINLYQKDVDGYELCLTALTHKAASVLRDLSEHKAITLHSFLGIRMNAVGNELRSVFPPIPKMPDRHILIIDEASMMDREVYDYLCLWLVASESKCIFIGDPEQITVKNGNVPCVFTKGIRTLTLTKNMRQDNPNLSRVANYLKDCVEKGTLPVLSSIPVMPELVYPDDHEELIKDWFNKEDSCVLLSYTNDKVLENNKKIRKLLGLPLEITEGDVLIVNSFKEKPRIHQDTAVKVQEVLSPTELQTTLGDIRLSSVRIRYRNEHNQLVVRDCELLSDLYKVTEANVIKRVIKSCEYSARRKDIAVLDARLPYAQTIHKSQGSTYDRVIIDLSSFNKCTSPHMFARLLYVAISRARKEVAFLGQLPQRLT